MANVLVVDIALHARSVCLPDDCPECHLPLKVEGGLNVQPIFAVARLLPVETDDKSTIAGTVIRDSHPSEWICRNCGKVVASGKIIFTAGPKV